MNERWAGSGEILSALEDKELPLLAWGVVDGFLSADEVDEVIVEALSRDLGRLGQHSPTIEEYRDYLLENGLLVRIPDSPEPRYRTRVAEYIRLLRRLRQLFPPTDQNQPDWWLGGAPLVADYRLQIQPRQYPERNVPPEDVARDLGDSTPDWSESKDAVVHALLGGRQAARFQVSASRAVLDAMQAPRSTGVIVTAGTGSGKTLAFYLPAFVHLVDSLRVPAQQVHTLALYPRNELLRDQARECIRAALNLASAPEAASLRPLRVGLLYGNTPWSGSDLSRRWRQLGWTQRATGFVSPYFPCPGDDCTSDLLWRAEDRAASREVLSCPRCGLTTPDGMLALTRESLISAPPDILFSTTEMLSRQSTDPKLGRLLGWTGSAKIRLVLLDEAHTYSGVHGAQVALMLRRWQHAMRQSECQPAFVGLSATLKDPASFFARLTGVDERLVEAIAPREDELRPIGREYALVLRGDPVSGTSLLSTTIQSSMLSGRILDKTPGLFGSSMFLFTDDLDVTNRLYGDLSDAEGRPNRAGSPTRAVLANLRDPGAPQAQRRYADGQNWELPKRLGRLGPPLRVAVTSSQVPGVDAGADATVATASLEVGFNDPKVGLVLQHKAPRDAASFIQRRGRAGRSLAMRPITCVVLSDYGRDQVAYQTYEQLLSPEIDRRRLPVGNRYVQKIQATHCMLDWLYRRTGIDVRRALTPPGVDRQAADRCVQALASVVDHVADQRNLQRHLQFAMGLSEDQALAVMWDEPRSLMLSAIPTALRRLQAGWTSWVPDPDPMGNVNAPLPDFMTTTLFNPLNTPDVELLMPAGMLTTDPQRMEVSRALREAVPGRVSRRFGYASSNDRTWLPLPEGTPELELSTFVAGGQRHGYWTSQSGRRHFVVRPLSVQLQQPPAEVTDYSSAQPVWESEFLLALTDMASSDVPTPSRWDSLVTGVHFGTHMNGSPATIRRMATGAKCEVAETRGSKTTRRTTSVEYVHEGEPAAMGFEGQYDALVVDMSLPEHWVSELSELADSPAWRVRAFQQRVLEDDRLDGLANQFQRGWLSSIYLNAFALRGIDAESTFDVGDALAGGRWANDLDRYFAVVYRQEEAAVAASPSRLAATLESLSADARVRSVIEEHAQLLWVEGLAIRTQDLLARAVGDTAAAALVAAARELLADSGDGDVLADVLRAQSLDPASFRIVLSEASIGGLGLIEQLQIRYARDPRGFWDRVNLVASATEYEDAHEVLRKVMDLTCTPGSSVAEAVASFRAADTAQRADRALKGLIDSWSTHLGSPSHLEMSTFATRVLRPGATEDTDRFLRDLLNRWEEWEASIGVEIDARTVAFAAAQGLLGVPATSDADTVYSLLWIRGNQARKQRLDAWQPYAGGQIVERLMLERLTSRPIPTVDVSHPDWELTYAQLLADHGEVQLEARLEDHAVMGQSIRLSSLTPIERGPLRVYGRLVSVDRRMGRIVARISMAEDLQ